MAEWMPIPRVVNGIGMAVSVPVYMFDDWAALVGYCGLVVDACIDCRNSH